MDTTFNYDETSDTLYVSFAPGEKGTGLELNENLLLRVNKSERRAVGLSVFNYSLLAQPTETGRRSLPLSGLADFSPETRALALDVLKRPPVSELLMISTYTPSTSENTPLVSFRDAILPMTA